MPRMTEETQVTAAKLLDAKVEELVRTMAGTATDDRCRFRQNSTEHGWSECLLRLSSHEAESNHTMNTQVNTVCRNLLRMHDKQRSRQIATSWRTSRFMSGKLTGRGRMLPVVAQPDERAAGDVLVQKDPTAAAQSE